MPNFHDISTIRYWYYSFSDATFDIFKTIDKTKFHVLSKHWFLMGKNIVQNQQWFEKHYKECDAKNNH